MPSRYVSLSVSENQHIESKKEDARSMQSTSAAAVGCRRTRRSSGTDTSHEAFDFEERATCVMHRSKIKPIAPALDSIEANNRRILMSCLCSR